MRAAHARTADIKGEVGDVVGLVGQQDGVAVLPASRGSPRR